jgi:hypothetical protein
MLAWNHPLTGHIADITESTELPQAEVTHGQAASDACRHRSKKHDQADHRDMI